MHREDFSDYLTIALKVLGAILLLLLIGGSLYTVKRVDTTLKTVETNVDVQIKEAISKFAVPSMGPTRQAPSKTTTASATENITTIVAKAQASFANNDVFEGRKQLVLLEQALAKIEGTGTARQLNRELIAAIDRADITAAQELSDKLLKELEKFK